MSFSCGVFETPGNCILCLNHHGSDHTSFQYFDLGAIETDARGLFPLLLVSWGRPEVMFSVSWFLETMKWPTEQAQNDYKTMLWLREKLRSQIRGFWTF